MLSIENDKNTLLQHLSSPHWSAAYASLQRLKQEAQLSPGDRAMRRVS